MCQRCTRRMLDSRGVLPKKMPPNSGIFVLTHFYLLHSNRKIPVLAARTAVLSRVPMMLVVLYMGACLCLDQEAILASQGAQKIRVVS